MVAACDMGMSPVMRADGERRKSLLPKLSGGSGSGRGVESGDRGEADGMTTDRSSLRVRSVFMYMLRGETSRGECKDTNITCSVSKRDPRFHLGDRTRWRTQSACVNLASLQVRPDTPFRNCKQTLEAGRRLAQKCCCPGGSPRAPMARSMAHGVTPFFTQDASDSEQVCPSRIRQSDRRHTYSHLDLHTHITTNSDTNLWLCK